MAVFFGLLSSAGFQWLQLGIFIWQAIRPAAALRVPWALFSSVIYKILGMKKFDSDHFVLLSTDYNDTADANMFCEENKRFVCERPLGDSSVDFWYNNCHYIAGREKASQVRLLICAEQRNLPIVKEDKMINGVWGIWNLCSADEAIRMCLPSKAFKMCFRKTVSGCLIEHMPLVKDTYWLSRVLGGIPLYLTAKGNEHLASIVTVSLIILDLTYNIWVPALEKAYLMFVRIVQLVLSKLSPFLRYSTFYALSNFDIRYLPCSITDCKVKIISAKVFYTTDNTVLSCPYTTFISQEKFLEVDTRKNTFEFQLSLFRINITKLQEGNDMVEFELKLLDVLWNRVSCTYRMSQHNFQIYIGFWELVQKGHVALVQTVNHGFIKHMHLFGYEEGINLFWGSNVNVFKVEVEDKYWFLIAGENGKYGSNFNKKESLLCLAFVRMWCRILSQCLGQLRQAFFSVMGRQNFLGLLLVIFSIGLISNLGRT
ncbi:hypothetical protein SUGI_0563420 [Cryptomeria japonica]|nr:hypothetical protein SUGI_0563420 [Cryptomeria japonica]